MKKVLIISVKESSHRTDRAIDQLKKINCPYEFIRWKSLVFKNGELFSADKKINLKKFCAVFFDIPRYEVILRKKNQQFSFNLSNELFLLFDQCRKFNIKVINRNFILSHPHYNKFTLSQAYFEKNLSAIPTLHFTDNKFEHICESLENFDIKLPIVVKQSDGSMGEQVWKISTLPDLRKLLETKRADNLVFQPFIKNQGDFRILVIGGKSMGIMKRTAQNGEWKNNYSLGGKIKKYADKKMERFSEKVARKLDLDYVGIDLLKTKDDYLIIELNIFASFEGFEKTYPKINIAKELVNLLIA
ncbi:MAG: ATP-grasp domain-containing protein [Candidatus Moranbacteria bacterium]|nr:ATP-grasp domain-containing protein [Candidatus Moranbacteria bacterium]